MQPLNDEMHASLRSNITKVIEEDPRTNRSLFEKKSLNPVIVPLFSGRDNFPIPVDHKADEEKLRLAEENLRLREELRMLRLENEDQKTRSSNESSVWVEGLLKKLANILFQLNQESW